METNGADIIVYKSNVKYVIQVKFYNNPVGNKAVQEVTGALGMYKADKGIVVTNSTFTPSAVELANANNIELVDGNKLDTYRKIIRKNGNSKTDEIATYISEVLEMAESRIKEIYLEEEEYIDKIIATIGEYYVIKENFINYNDEDKIQRFIDGVLKYGVITIGNIEIKLKEYEKLVNVYTRAGIYKYDIEKQVEQIKDNETLDEKEKHDMIQKVFEEYVSNDDEYNTSRYVALNLYFNVNLIMEDDDNNANIEDEENVDSNSNMDDKEIYSDLDDLDDLDDFDEVDDFDSF